MKRFNGDITNHPAFIVSDLFSLTFAISYDLKNVIHGNLTGANLDLALGGINQEGREENYLGGGKK